MLFSFTSPAFYKEILRKIVARYFTENKKGKRSTVWQDSKHWFFSYIDSIFALFFQYRKNKSFFKTEQIFYIE